jgi:AAA family ATP:ADP antiporter
MLTSVLHYFYPDLNKDETRKFGLLSLTFFLIIGGYWLVRLLKNTLFYKIAFPEALGWLPEQGRLFQPLAKFWSPLFVFALVMVYTKLIDMFKKETLFYIICSVYTVVFGSITASLIVRDVYGDAFLGKWALAAIGWISFFAIESFGSLIVALFWSFTNSVCTSESAKSGYPMIIAAAQLGAIGGSSLILFAHKFGIWQLFAVVTFFVISIMVVIRYFMRVIPKSQLVGNKQAAATVKKKEGFLEGLLAGIRLIATRPYIFGILIVSTLYEVINQVIEYQMQTQACAFPRFTTEIGFAQFQGIYGVAANTLSFLMALLGTSYLIKRYGLRFGLLFFPVCLTIAFSFLYLFYAYGSPTAGQLLGATFFVMMIAKGLGYAVNNPVKEMMYIPTSKDVKFKSKGFIDVFGGRMSKLGGAQINNTFKSSLNDLMVYGTFFSFGLTAIWILAAIYVGNKNKQLVADGEIVE